MDIVQIILHCLFFISLPKIDAKDVDYFYENQYYKIRYTGQIRDGAPNGKGSGRGQLTYFNEKSQFTYEGVWRNGLPNKDGEITYAAHGFYKQRPWKNGYWVVNQTFSYDVIKINAPQYIVQIREFIYTGQMIDGFPDGYGKAVSYQNGQFYAAYEGLWKKGFPNPFGGLITSPSSVYNGSYYFGMWENGSFLGSKGEYKYPSGSTFKGIFDFNGPVYGSIDFKNNQTYTGMMSSFKANGLGSINLGNGRFYIGPFKNGKFDTSVGTTIGTYVLPDGRVYEGQYEEGVAIGIHLEKLSNGHTRRVWIEYTGDKTWNFTPCSAKYNC
jgi:hypothetical protein